MSRKKKIKRKKAKKSKQFKSKRKPKASFLQGPIHKTKIRIVGIGGGGSSIVSEIAQRITSLGKKKISFVVANTDLRALKRTSSKTIRLRFGKQITFGLGTGMSSELGEEAAKGEKEKITKILESQDLIILISSLGGGVGSGAAPVFAKISKKLGNLTCGIFTLPFRFEGEKKMEIAKSALRKLRRRLNTLTIIPNERIFQIVDKKTPLTNALSIINKNLAKSLEGLLEMIYQPGLINIDFADLKTILGKRGKIAYLNTIEVKGENRVQKAVKELISSPMYPYTISGAKGILFNISGESNLKLSEVNQISQAIWELVKGKAKIIFGISKSKKLKDKIKITLLATGCRSRISFASKKSKQKRIKIKKKGKLKKKKKKKTERKKSKKIKTTTHPRTGAPVTREALAPRPPEGPKRKFGRAEGGSESRKRAPKKKAKSKKIKVKIRSKLSTVKEKKEIKSSGSTQREEKAISPKVRRNALQVKKVFKEEEEKLLAEEKKWETPAFLRKKE